jgi:hypothetical protein
MSCPSIRMRPFHVVEPQEQLHQRRLSRTGPSDEPHLLAGTDGQIQSVETARAAPVVVGHAVEPISPLSNVERLALRRVGQRDGCVIVSIPSATTPKSGRTDDTAHMIQPVMALSRSVSAVAAATVPPSRHPRPKPDGPAHDSHDQQPVQDRQDDVHDGEQPHFLGEGPGACFRSPPWRTRSPGRGARRASRRGCWCSCPRSAPSWPSAHRRWPCDAGPIRTIVQRSSNP